MLPYIVCRFACRRSHADRSLVVRLAHVLLAIATSAAASHPWFGCPYRDVGMPSIHRRLDIERRKAQPCSGAKRAIAASRIHIRRLRRDESSCKACTPSCSAACKMATVHNCNVTARNSTGAGRGESLSFEAVSQAQ